VKTVAQSGKANAAKVIGKVSGLKVLNTDILKTVTGSTTIDVAKILDSTINKINSTITTLTTVLTTVLATANIAMPTPLITVLKKSTSLDKTGPDTSALAKVTGLALSWKGALSVPNLVERAAVGSRAVSLLDVEANIATLSDSSNYTVASTTSTPTTPTTTPSNTPDLANTGLPVGISVTALLLLFAAYTVRRFRRTELVTTD
jgi:hypothetical protein